MKSTILFVFAALVFACVGCSAGDSASDKEIKAPTPAAKPGQAAAGPPDN